MADALIEIDNLRHSIGGREILSVPALHLAKGQHGLLLGPSGSGKTTLLNLLAGLLPVMAGSFKLLGQDMRQLGPVGLDRLRAQHIGIVFQQLHLIEAVSIADNLRLAQTLAGHAVDEAVIRDLLSRVGLGDRAKARPSDLSQGERQRVAVARALVNRPALLLADEPTSALDDENCAAALDLLLQQAELSGATLLIATHDQRLTARVPVALRLTKPEGVAA